MSQAEILKVLEDVNMPLALQEIAQRLNDDKCKINKSLKQMIKYNEVSYIEIDRRISLRFFKTKRRMKLYYI